MDRIRLDNNEGGRLSDDQALSLSACGARVLREYPSAIELERRIANRFGVETERVVVTAGADDAIDRCFRVFLVDGRSLILTAPTFQQFHRFAASTPATVREIVWDEVFPLEEILRSIDATTAIVAFATPNNPTGRVVDRSALERIASAVQDGIVLLDHAYVEYAEDDFTEFAATLPNVVTVRTFSKAWGLAGCRVGYAIAPTAAAQAIRGVGNPYPVSGSSMTTVIRRLDQGISGVDAHVQRVRVEREQVSSTLRQYGVATTPSHANFVFADFGERATFVQRALSARNIGVRAFPDRADLRHGLRISVPDDKSALDYTLDSFGVILNPEALLLDMDGVLADVSGSYDRCVRETTKHFGVDVSDDEVDEVVLGGNANNDWVVVQRLLSQHGRDVPLAEIRDHFQMLYEGDAQRPGYAEDEKPVIDPDKLCQLAGGRAIGVVTGRPRVEARDFLNRFGLASVITVVVCMEDANAKPDPAPVTLALDKLGVSRAWMVGDSPDDIVAARLAGVLPVGIARSSTRHSALLKAGAATVLPEVGLLRSYLP